MSKKGSRSPVQVSPEFKARLDDWQKKNMMLKGEKISLRDITSEIVKSPMFDELEKSILRKADMNMSVKIKFDRRFLK